MVFTVRSVPISEIAPPKRNFGIPFTNTTMTPPSAQQQNNTSTQPPATVAPAAGGSLFGGTGTTAQSSMAGSLFGGAAGQQQAATGTGLFGSANTSAATTQPQQTGSLFGGAQATQPAGSLFGNNNAQNTQQTGGGLFGSSLAVPSATAQRQPGRGNSLFGGAGNAPAQQQQGGSLFGSLPGAQVGSGSLFGGSGGATQQPQQQQSSGLFGASTQQSQQQQSGGLFGASTQQKPTTSLFGASATNNTAGPAAAGNSLFGTSSLFNTNPQQQQQQQAQQQQQQGAQGQGPSIFGLSTHQPPPGSQQPSLLGASQYRNPHHNLNAQSFAGRLTLGQQPNLTQQPPQLPQQTQGAVKITFDEMRPTTRYADLIPEIQGQLEAIDKMIQAQERFAREIEAFIPAHGINVASLGPDVAIVREKAEAVEGSLALDASGVEAQRRVLEADKSDFGRCERVVGNLALPGQYRYLGHGGAMTGAGAGAAGGGEGGKDMDLVSNFFTPLATSLQQSLKSYASNLGEIEAHMRVIEQSASAQGQTLAARRAGITNDAGGNGGEGSGASVRELAETLRGFEGSILSVAGLVGECREGVNGLVLSQSGRRVY